MRGKKLWFMLSLALILPAQVAAANKLTALHVFKGFADGAEPVGGLTFDAAGNLYSTTTIGGDSSNCGTQGCGTVFELSPNSDGTWTESVLHSFTGADGFIPMGALVFDAAGNLYGTTKGGGASPNCQGGTRGCGTVFELSPNLDGSWTESVLYSFTNAADGALPLAGVILDTAGNLYGTASSGGASQSGVVFKLTNGGGSWTESTLYAFTDGADGGGPSAGLVFDAAGNLYGTTIAGGNLKDQVCYLAGCGVVFKLTPNSDGTWTETTLRRFPHFGGAHPQAGVIFDTAGNLYGTTPDGGNTDGEGVVFKLAPQSNGSWKETVIHRFGGRAHPYAGLTFDAAGNLYGTTYQGGSSTDGVVFKLTPQSGTGWSLSDLVGFHANPEAFPVGSLIFDNTGNLYGMNYEGNHNYGTVFKLIP